MAILPECPGLSVGIIVGNDHNTGIVSEFNDDELQPPETTTKYIEAISDAPFSICVKFGPEFEYKHSMRVVIDIDGLDCVNSCIDVDEIRPRRVGRSRSVTYSGSQIVANGIKYIRQFRFSALEIVEEVNEEVDIDELESKIAREGLIGVELFATEITGKRPLLLNEVDFVNPPQGPQALSAIPEEALKGDSRSHQVTLDEGVEAVPKDCDGFLTNKDIDGPFAEAFVRFNFLYRSRASLQALQIIPRDEADPPAVRAEEENDAKPTMDTEEADSKPASEGNTAVAPTTTIPVAESDAKPVPRSIMIDDSDSDIEWTHTVTRNRNPRKRARTDPEAKREPDVRRESEIRRDEEVKAESEVRVAEVVEDPEVIVLDD